MLKKRELNESHALYDLMRHPDVFPFVRHKAYSYEEYLFLTKQTIEAEERSELISRTILDEWGAPIGTINLYDIENKTGFLGTWLGKPFHGKGYNQPAKDAFFRELFFELEIETVLMKIRKDNIRSQKAAEKLPYVIQANVEKNVLYRQYNDGYIYYEISKDSYSLYMMREQHNQQKGTDQLLEA